MNPINFLYVPHFSARQTSVQLPRDILFMPSNKTPEKNYPGSFTKLSDEQQQFILSIAAKYPVSAPLMRSILHELHTFGNLHFTAKQERIDYSAFSDSRQTAFRDEVSLLNNFSKTGTISSNAQLTEKIPENQEEHDLINAQIMIELLFSFEKNIEEIEAINKQVSASKETLHSILSSSEASEPQLHKIATDQENTENSLAVSLQFISAVTAFLPESTWLVTTNEQLTHYYLEQQLPQPLSEETLKHVAHWPTHFLDRLMIMHQPVWRLIGKASPKNEHTWLNTSRQFLIYCA